MGILKFIASPHSDLGTGAHKHKPTIFTMRTPSKYLSLNCDLQLLNRVYATGIPEEIRHSCAQQTSLVDEYHRVDVPRFLTMILDL
jgi:hypothetical protein